VQAQIASLGSNLLMVRRASAWARAAAAGPPFAAADVEAIASQIGGVRRWRRGAAAGAWPTAATGRRRWLDAGLVQRRQLDAGLGPRADEGAPAPPSA
jgi:hypothetical protein